MQARGKTAIVVAGYVSALAVALVVTVAYQHLNPNTDPNDSMRDIGDAFLFLAVFGFAALLPTAALFYFLRNVAWFWYLAALVGVAFNLLGIVTLATIRYQLAGSLEAVTAFGVLTILGSPILAFAFLAGALATSVRRVRHVLLITALVEALVCITYFAHALFGLA